MALEQFMHVVWETISWLPWWLVPLLR